MSLQLLAEARRRQLAAQEAEQPNIAELLSQQGNTLLNPTRRSGVTQQVSPDERPPAGYRGDGYFDMLGSAATLMIPGGKAANIGRAANAVSAATRVPVGQMSRQMAGRAPSMSRALVPVQQASRMTQGRARSAAAAAGTRGAGVQTAGMPGRAAARGAYPPTTGGPLTEAQRAVARLTGNKAAGGMSRQEIVSKTAAAVTGAAVAGSLGKLGIEKLNQQIKRERTADSLEMAGEILVPQPDISSPELDRVVSEARQNAQSALGLNPTPDSTAGDDFEPELWNEELAEARLGMDMTADGRLPQALQDELDTLYAQGDKRLRRALDRVETHAAYLKSTGEWSESQIRNWQEQQTTGIYGDFNSYVSEIDSARLRAVQEFTMTYGIPAAIESVQAQRKEAGLEPEPVDWGQQAKDMEAQRNIDEMMSLQQEQQFLMSPQWQQAATMLSQGDPQAGVESLAEYSSTMAPEAQRLVSLWEAKLLSDGPQASDEYAFELMEGFQAEAGEFEQPSETAGRTNDVIAQFRAAVEYGKQVLMASMGSA